MARERLYYVDWLRVLVILTLIPYHTALTFTGLGMTYIFQPVSNITILPLLAFTASLDNFFMTLLFFLSGIGTYYALQRRSIAQYCSERIRKLFVPLIAGLVTICPAQAYTKALYHGYQGNLFSFLKEFFSRKVAYYLGYAHLWFLLYLFVFSMLCIPLFKKLKDGNNLKKTALFLSEGKNILIPFLFVMLAELFLRPFFPGTLNLVSDWANFIVYLSVFIFGFIFAYDGGIQEKFAGLTKIATTLVAVLVPVLTGLYYCWVVLRSSSPFVGFAWVVSKAVYQCAMIVFVMGLGKKFLNKNNSIYAYLNKASFSYYFWHYLPVTILILIFIPLKMPLYLKFFAIVILSYGFLFLFYEFILRRIPLLKAKKQDV